jgi:hypothetical protein
VNVETHRLPSAHICGRRRQEEYACPVVIVVVEDQCRNRNAALDVYLPYDVLSKNIILDRDVPGRWCGARSI